MCLLCAAKQHPSRTVLATALAYQLIDLSTLVWLAMFALSMSFMDHRRDLQPSIAATNTSPTTTAVPTASDAALGATDMATPDAASAATAAPALAAGPYKPGDYVRLHGLQSRSDLNGLLGVVIAKAGPNGRLPVVCMIDGSQQEAFLKPGNLSPSKLSPSWYTPPPPKISFAPPKVSFDGTNPHGISDLCLPCHPDG